MSGSGIHKSYCDCPDTKIDKYPKSLHCSDCEIAVVEAYFESNLLGIELVFPYTVTNHSAVGNVDVTQFSTTLCTYLFTSTSMTQLGDLPQCR